jgi:microcystin degradation protein MlrC
MTKGVRFSLGPTAVLRSGGVRVLVTTSNMQVYDLQVFLTQGIDPRTCTVVAVKSWHHFRASFEPLSRKVMLVESGGWPPWISSDLPSAKFAAPSGRWMRRDEKHD